MTTQDKAENPVTLLHIDIETRSDINLSKAGVYPYSESPQFQILLFAYAFNDEPVTIVDLASGERLSQGIIKALSEPHIIKVAHNASFERVCLSRFLYGAASNCFLDASQWRCTMVHAAMLGLPFSLDSVAKVLGTGEQKNKAGVDLIKYFCVPCKPTKTNGGRTWNEPSDAPIKWQMFKDYCIQDVATERAIHDRLQMLPVPAKEQELYVLDQQINDRGVLIDTQMVEKAIQCDLLHSEVLTQRAYELTDLENPNSVSQLKTWLDERGLAMNTLGKKQVAAQIKDLEKNCCDAELLEMLKLRLQMAKSSVKKYQAAERAVCADGRARGLFRFYGANHTGRWCLTGEHEVLTEHGWLRLDKWTEGNIACWNPDTAAIDFLPAKQVSFPYSGLMYWQESQRISQISTPDHKMYCGDCHGNYSVRTVAEMSLFRPQIPITGFCSVQKPMNEEQLRVLIMTQADGSFAKRFPTLTLHFSKPRKIKRCKELLTNAGVDFSETVCGNGSVVIRVSWRTMPAWLAAFADKTFGDWLLWQPIDAVLDELAQWDGYKVTDNSIQYSTCNKRNADLVQALCCISGKTAVILQKRAVRDKHSIAYVVDIWLNPGMYHELRSKPQVFEYEGTVYCAMTQTGFFLVRRNGKVWITGNSGRSLQLQNLPQNHLRTLDEARELLKLGCYDALDYLYGNTPDVLSQLIRTMLIPRPGCEFVVADFSAIEARVLAWLAGETWRLDSFDSGADIYCASATQMFGVPVVKNGVNGELRQKGKVAELACIAEGQLVLTNAGYTAIQNVQKDMLIWDGRAWVKHEGVVKRGFRRTITFEGLTATPDHLVWNGYCFIPFEYYAAMADRMSGGRNILYSGLKPVYDIKNAGPRHQYLVNGHIVHNCGYGGGAGALIAMGALDMGLKEAELPGLIKDWRASNPKIVQFWWDVDKAATATVKDGSYNKVGRIAFERYAGEMFITLPSGRKIAFASPRLEPNKFGRMGITYMGIGSSNKWQRLETYGPKIVENIVQGAARDLLAEAMLRVSQAGLNVVLHVHDEMCVEAPINSLSVDKLCTLMSVNPEWADGLPLAAAGYTCPYYQKD